MSEMVERVARAVYEALLKHEKDYVGEYQDRYKLPLTQIEGDFDLVRVSRAAIEAMREPTQPMKDRGHNAGWHGCIEGDPIPEEEAAASLWQSMIGAALERQPTLSVPLQRATHKESDT